MGCTAGKLAQFVCASSLRDFLKVKSRKLISITVNTYIKMTGTRFVYFSRRKEILLRVIFR